MSGACTSNEARTCLSGFAPRELFPSSFAPEAALSGMWLYFSCADECHQLCQDLETIEGSYWHAILHRQEPDAFNSGYWFRRVGEHAIFPPLAGAARESGLQIGARWDPFRFIDYCESARERPGSPEYSTACEVQRAEWQLLFDYCARRQA